MKVVMTLWSQEMNSRTQEDATSIKGRMEAATYNQTRVIKLNKDHGGSITWKLRITYIWANRYTDYKNLHKIKEGGHQQKNATF